MNAIIYAAGRATRLGREHAHHPKLLLEFGGRSLLEWHLRRLLEIGVRSVFVVTGHEHRQIESAMNKLRQKYRVELQELYNPDFCEGSVLSMMVSLSEVQKTTGQIYLMDGDVLYERRLLQVLAESKHPSALLLDRGYSTLDDDPVLVPVRGGRPVEFMKGWKGEADFVGESVGFFKLDAADIPLLVHETCARVAGPRRLESLDEVLRALVRQNRFGFEEITGLRWTEIDFPHDIEFAENKVLPHLLELERAPAEKASQNPPPSPAGP
jgi:choline kinase